jgi:hypothetical protein
VAALTINRLAQHDIEGMIDRVVGNKLVPAGVRKDIIERTDGIPLFVEEMTKSVLEAGSEAEVQRTAATVPFTALAVPASLHASLMARLDRLGPAKGLHRSGPPSGASSPMRYLLPRSVSRKLNFNRRWTVSSRQVCCFAKECRHRRATCSNTRWCRTRPMAPCCASRGACSMPGSPKPSKVSSPHRRKSTGVAGASLH